MKLNCHVILISSFSPNFDNVFDSAAELGTCEVIELGRWTNGQVKSAIITVITVHFFNLDLKPVSYFPESCCLCTHSSLLQRFSHVKYHSPFCLVTNMVYLQFRHKEIFVSISFTFAPKNSFQKL